jgi:tetratricopeptide (TPR) repeat protein
LLIKENPYITRLQSIYSYFSQEDGIVDEKDLGVYHTGFYRPLINVTYSIDYKIWGMNAYGFRTTNLILHLISSFIIFKFFCYFFSDYRTAFWCALLFSIHPANTESVSFIVARNNILVTLFSISSFYFYVTAIEKKQYIKMLFSLIFFACALLSKEFGIMILPVFFIYNKLLVTRKKSTKTEALSYLPYIIIAIFYLYLRHMVTGNMITPFNDPQWLKRLYFVPYILAWNLRISLLPYGLHQFNISYPSSFLDPYAILSIAIVFLLFLILWIKRDNKIFVFSCLSFLIIIFPVLSIIPSAATPNTLVSLRWTYLPIVFILLGISKAIEKYLTCRKILIQCILFLCVCYFGTYTYILNRFYWHDEKTLFNQEVFLFNNMSHSGGVAEYFFNDGKLTEAEKYYKIAIDYSPDKAHNYINYSALLIKIEKFNDAIFLLNKAKDMIMVHHEQGQWHNNMGMALLGNGNVVESLNYFHKAVKLAPEEAMFWSNLGGAFGIIGKYDESVEAFKNGIAVSPDSIELRINLAMSYIKLNNYKGAFLTLDEIPENEKRGNEKILKLLEQIQDKIK